MSEGEKRQWLHDDRPHRGLQEFIDRAEGAGELLRVKGVNRDLEMGALAEAVSRSEAKALLFEAIAG